MGSPEYREKVLNAWDQCANDPERRFSRPEQLILHDMADEKTEPLVFLQNSNYRVSRKYINAEKVKILKEQALQCVRSAGTARFHKCTEIHKRLQAAVRVSSNVDRGPVARKRDVGFIYHTHKMNELQRQAAELDVEFPFPSRNVPSKD